MMRTHRRFWRLVERLVLTIELPALFGLALLVALGAALMGRSTAALLLLLIAALVALVWASLARPPRHRRP